MERPPSIRDARHYEIIAVVKVYRAEIGVHQRKVSEYIAKQHLETPSQKEKTKTRICH